MPASENRPSSPLFLVILVVKKEGKLYRRIVSIDIHAQFQFCPNHWSSRLALYTNSTDTSLTLLHYHIAALDTIGAHKVQSQTIPLDASSTGSRLCLMNTHTWSTAGHQYIHFDADFRLLSLQYTPDSVYLIFTFVDNRCHCDQTSSTSYFDLYHASTLQRLHRIDVHLIPRICSWHMCQNLLTPIFSIPSSRMAFCTTKHNAGKELQVSVVVLPNELNLKFICRRWIVHYLREFNGDLESVLRELPYRLSQYVQYRPEYQ